MKTVIYGAQGFALGAYNSIKELFPSYRIICFLVTKIGMNSSSLCGIPVRELEEFASAYSQSEKDNIRVLIATPENVMEDIEKNLDNYGFYNHICLNSNRWSDMQRNAFIRNKKFIPLEVYPVGTKPSNLYVYKAKFHNDKKLKTQFTDPNYITPIQVGASQTNIRVADILDNLDDNISDKNGNYSELTGLYWIWKNRLINHYYGVSCYYGLAHYRRLLDLSEDDLLRLNDNDIDVILPYPMPYAPDIEEHHKRYLSDSEWNSVLQALEELQPEYAVALKDILKQEYLYNYNIIIAKSAILEEYCRWLFSLLFRIEEINDSGGIKRTNRYMGYVGETLETLYFMYHKNHLRIVHTGCKFLT